MHIEDIAKSKAESGIDVIAILEGGRYCVDSFIEYLRSIGANNIYQYEMFPRQRSGTKGEPWVYSISPRRRPRKRQDKYIRMAKKRGLIPGDMGLDEFNSNPGVRFVGEPTPGHLALLVDDYVDRGTAAKSCVEDLTGMGYRSGDIFVVSWDIIVPFLYDADMKIMQGFPVTLVQKFQKGKLYQ